jgi:hypothetical protein
MKRFGTRPNIMLGTEKWLVLYTIHENAHGKKLTLYIASGLEILTSSDAVQCTGKFTPHQPLNILTQARETTIN